MLRPLIVLSVLFIVAGPAKTSAQDTPPEQALVQTATTAASATVRAVVDLLRGLSTEHVSMPFDRIADRLGPGALEISGEDDLDSILEMLADIREDLEDLQDDLDDGDAELSEDVDDILNQVDRASGAVRSLRTDGDRGDGWLKPGDYRRGKPMSRGDRRERDEDTWEADDDSRDRSGWEDADEDDWDSDEDEDWDHGDWWSGERRSEWRRSRSHIRHFAPAFVGDFSDSWPFHETGLYRPAPVWRYNRVDGLVLGFRRLPLEWDSYDRTRVYGQVAYAFALKDWRYEVGVESRLGRPYREQGFDFKVGANYRRETGSNDTWKTSWVENSLAAFFARTDFFDYFETEGYSLYASARVSPLIQLTAAYRVDDYDSLVRETNWSVFRGNDFRLNTGIDDGRMQSVVLAVDGGQLRGYRHEPSGVAFRGEVELGRDFGGEFDFNRFTADVRSYTRIGRDAGLRLRFRGSTSEGILPVQKQYTLGGAGSVRAYPQNAFPGNKMALANAELSLYEVDLFDELFDDIELFGLFDAGWTDYGRDTDFDVKDALTAAGLGLGFADGIARFELAWPLKDVGTGMEPTLWFRLNPTF